MADRFVTTESRIFDDQMLQYEVDRAQQKIEAAIDSATDDEVLEAAADVWAEGLASATEIEPPTIDFDNAKMESGGRIQVNCTNDKAGMTMTSTELYGSLCPPGLQVHVPSARERQHAAALHEGLRIGAGLGEGRQCRGSPRVDLARRTRYGSISERGEHVYR